MLVDETIKILKNHNIRLNKRKGQNYLINSDVLGKIIDYARLSKDDSVLEIGAGIGTLTIPIARLVGKVIAIEQDKKIAKILKERLKYFELSNVDVINADATKIDFPPFDKVVSNLPYKISSPITFKLLDYDFDFGILMYQLEFAERMVAKPGDPNYSRLSLMLNLFADFEVLKKVSKHAFIPKPKVSSAMVRLVPKKHLNIDELFLKVSRALFQHKRKKARNALADSFHEIADMDKKTIKNIISKLNRELMEKRVVDMGADEVMSISNELKEVMKNL